ncbi:TolC family protein [Duganella sp. PWIR1]
MNAFRRSIPQAVSPAAAPSLPSGAALPQTALPGEALLRQALLSMALFTAALLHTDATAQELPPTLDLRAAIRLVLERSPEIELQRYTESAAQGIALSSRAPFDLVTSTTLGGTRDRRPLRADERARALAAGADQLVDANAVTLGATRQLDSGVQLSGAYALTRAADNVQEAQNIPRQTSDRLTFTVRVPLRKNTGRDQLAARNATELEAVAARRDTEQVIARAVLGVVQAYWDWAARVAAADVARGAEARMQQLRRETEKLVAEDELPPAELNLLTAAMTERETASIGAQQRARDGRYALGRLYGMGALETDQLPSPIEPLPERAAAPGLEALGPQALERRADLAALRLREQAMAERLAAARSNNQPVVDLDLSAYYAGLREGARPVSAAFDPTSHRAGPGVAAKLSVQLPLENSANNGALRTAAANADSARVRRSTQEQTVQGNVAAAYLGYNSYVAQLRASEQTIERYRAALRDTLTKRQLGSATLIDVLNVEDRLNNAILARLQYQQGYALARAQILYESGALLRTAPDGTLSVALDELLP